MKTIGKIVIHFLAVWLIANALIESRVPHSAVKMAGGAALLALWHLWVFALPRAITPASDWGKAPDEISKARALVGCWVRVSWVERSAEGILCKGGDGDREKFSVDRMWFPGSAIYSVRRQDGDSVDATILLR